MIYRPVSTLPLVGLLLLANGGWSAVQAAGARPIAVLAVQNLAGDARAVDAVDEALRLELSDHGELVDADAIRRARRRLRIRDTDQTSPGLLADLADELSADWLVSVTVHDAERRAVPRLTLSARVYDATGQPFWVGFEGGSGLDTRKMLGLGVINDIEMLAPRVVSRLFSTLVDASPGHTESESGSLAIVPFGSLTARHGTAASQTMTEAARAAIFAHGLDVASPNCTHSALRSLRSSRWGAVDAAMRKALTTYCGATSILTGAVEAYDIGGAELEPEPKVAVAMRLLDAETGMILWTGALARQGWDRAGLFRLGRIYSRGTLTERMMDKLTRDLAPPDRLAIHEDL